MKIKKLVVRNIKSFGDEISIDFKKDLNIFIGPNRGGKSNLMDILNITLIYFFLYPWRTREGYNELGIPISKYFENRNTIIFSPINQFLEKHLKRKEENQLIKITFSPEEEDVKNINNVIIHQEKLINFEKEEYNSSILKDDFLTHLSGFDINSLVNEEIEFNIENNNPIQVGNLGQKERICLMYLNYFRLLNILIDEYNTKAERDENKIPRLFPPLIYFSPYRIPEISKLAINISSTDFFNLLEKYEKSHSKNISSSFEVANYYFAKKLLYLGNDFKKFEEEEEVKLLEEYVMKLGYSKIIYELRNRDKNIYEGTLINQWGEKLELSKASSGEKEILNLLMGIFAFNIKNGVVIIDEPELHLHPKWQSILLELFFDLSSKRGVQFFIVTHSPHFVSYKSIKSIFRVYSENGESQVVSPQNLTEDDKDLFMLVNIFNNTKVFFADKVILVEGDVDLIIYESILKTMQINMKSSAIIEIIEVQQKGGVEKNKNFLEKWQIKTYGILDKDKSINSQGVFILEKGEIENYFQDLIKKNKYNISDALLIAEKIRKNVYPIPIELKEIFEKIIKE